MQLPASLVLLILSAAQLAHALPAPHREEARDINISHKSLATGTSITHSIDSSDLPAELAQAIEGSDININLTTDRVKRSPSPATGINNSTINLTVIGTRSTIPHRKRDADAKRAQLAAAQHHNIHIDASTNGQGGIGGIHNSTVNINLNSATKKERRKVALGDHSVIVDVSSTSSADGESTGIEDSTVHVNILPPRALSKSTGHHSIVVDSSSASSDDAATTTTGDHSAVVDTSSSGSNSAGGTTGIKSSTINLTVISPQDSNEPSTPSSDTVESPIPSLARLSKRSNAALDAWASNIQRKSLDLAAPGASELTALEAAAEADAGFTTVRRDHSSRRAVRA
ncbi:hypothetical protein JCM21900_003726 [Sporobolomyces salmonicolor]